MKNSKIQLIAVIGVILLAIGVYAVSSPLVTASSLDKTMMGKDNAMNMDMSQMMQGMDEMHETCQGMMGSMGSMMQGMH